MPPISAMSNTTMYSLVSINIVTSILTIIVNYCFIAGMLCQPNLLTPTNLFIISLSVSDFLVGLIVQPLACALLLLTASGSTSCLLENLVFISLSVFCGASGLCVPIISLDRYIRMKKLQYYIKYVSKKRACIAIVCIWVNALVFAFTPFYGVPQDIFFILLIVYLVGCGLVMSIAYKSVVQRSVVFKSKHGNQNKKCEIIYTKKKVSTDCSKEKEDPKQVSFPMNPETVQIAGNISEPNTTACQYEFSENPPKSSLKFKPYQSPCKSSDSKIQSCFPSKCSSCNDDVENRSDSFEASQDTTSPSRSNSENRKRLASLENTRQMRITVTVCLLVLVIIISWMPTFVFSLIWALDKERMNTHEMVITLHYIALTFGFACSCVNPLLYCSRIRDVRKAAIAVFWKTSKCAPCRKQ